MRRGGIPLRAVLALIFLAPGCGACGPNNDCPAPKAGSAPTGDYALVSGQPATMSNLGVNVGASSNTLTVSYSQGGRKYVKTYRMSRQ